MEYGMKKMNIITPVKDSIELTLQTIKAITASQLSVPFSYTVYNDFSTPENTELLKEASGTYGFTLVNIADITDHPSPNYLLILQMAQKDAIQENAALIIVESDVTVAPGTLQKLFDESVIRKDCGIAAAVTVDSQGAINYPYLYAKGKENSVFSTRKHVSFCCSLLKPDFLNKYSFEELNPEKSWHDVTISHKSLQLGFNNYLFTTLPVLHQPHSSRPWKQLKYTNPLKYYWIKWTKGYDKI